jgi:Ca-activated chloride channel family protein
VLKPLSLRQATLLFLLVLLITSAVPVGFSRSKSAQNAPQSEVRLDVTVTDKSNHFVENLGLSDFRVLDNGVPQKIVQFSSAKVPLTYALVLDTSGSMRKLIPYVISAAKSIINSNAPDDETALIRFQDDNNVVQDWTQDKALLASALDGMAARGGTSLFDVVRLSALYVQKRREATRSMNRLALIVITDGVEKDSVMKKDQLIKDLQRLDVQVIMLGLVSELNKDSGLFHHQAEDEIASDTLRDVAAASGGQVFLAKKPGEAETIAPTITERLRSEYTVVYTPDRKMNPGERHKIEVKVAPPSGKDKYSVVAHHSLTTL